jgi:hypothetical protein
MCERGKSDRARTFLGGMIAFFARKERSFRARMVWRSVNEAGVASWANTTMKCPCRWSWPGACDKAKLRKRSCETASPS